MKKQIENFVEEWTAVQGRKVRLLTIAPYRNTAGDFGDYDGITLPLVLLHGLGCSARSWHPTLRELANRKPRAAVVAADMPGFGRSFPTPQTLDMDELAEWTARLLDERQLDRVHLCGNSMGCQVALSFARRFPDRTGALILQGPTLGGRIPLWRYIAGLLTDSVGESLPYNLLLMQMYTQMGFPRYLSTTIKMLQDDPIADANEVKAPCLVIRGGKDFIISDAMARRLVNVLPDADYMPLDSAAHAIEYTRPQEFVTAVWNYLHRAEGGIRQNEDKIR